MRPILKDRRNQKSILPAHFVSVLKSGLRVERNYYKRWKLKIYWCIINFIQIFKDYLVMKLRLFSLDNLNYYIGVYTHENTGTFN